MKQKLSFAGMEASVEPTGKYQRRLRVALTTFLPDQIFNAIGISLKMDKKNPEPILFRA